jgi:hypothetical protein
VLVAVAFEIYTFLFYVELDTLFRFSDVVFAHSCLGSLCRPVETLEVIKSLLRSEFERKALKEPGSILRGASLAAKMSSRHARTVGSAYLCDLFHDWIEGMKALPELNVEVPEDKNKLISITNDAIALMRWVSTKREKFFLSFNGVFVVF